MHATHLLYPLLTYRFSPTFLITLNTTHFIHTKGDSHFLSLLLYLPPHFFTLFAAYAQLPTVQLANVDNSVQNEIMNEAKANMAEWPNKTVFIKNYTSLAVHHVPGLIDFIYVDARHDYCGVGLGVGYGKSMLSGRGKGMPS